MFVLLLAACHRDHDVPTWVDPDGASLEVGEDGTLTLVAPGDARRDVHLAFGFVSAPVDSVNYDPWILKDPALAGDVPSGLAFATAVAATWTGSAYTLTLENDATASLTVDDTGPGLRLSVALVEGEAWAPYVSVSVDVAADETFYGLGETFDAVQHRGRIRPMQMELRTDLESSNNEVHAPVPLLVSNAGWGLLADSYRPGVFDVAATDPDVVEVVYDQMDGFTFDLYAPNSPAQVVARYHARAGAPEVPPTWAFAPMQWRNAVAGTEDVLADMAAIRDNGIPTGLIWVDNPWQSTYNSMSPDPAMFPDWGGLVETLHGNGFRVMAWTTPYLEDADPDHDAYADAGWFVDAPILFSDFGDWVDLTHPDAMAAWQARVADAADIGIEGWKLDYGEDTQLGFGKARFVYTFANGEDERTMHHHYASYYDAAYAEPYPDHAGFLLGRAGVLRGQTTSTATSACSAKWTRTAATWVACPRRSARAPASP
jgi:alpha-D-xyloside xylohydrolase